MTNDFERGLAAAKKHGGEPGWGADGESRQFWAGFAAYMRDENNLPGPSHADTADY